MLERLGAEVVLAPVVEAVPVAGFEALEALSEEVVSDPPAVMVLTSAGGVEAWLGAAEDLGRDQALRRTLAAARVLALGSATATAATSSGVGVDEVLADADGTGPSSAAVVGDLAGQRVAVQVEGGHPQPLVGGLRQQGAAVVEVAVPVAGIPEDREPALRLLQDLTRGRVEALTFTAPSEVRNLVALADGAGLHGEVVVALSEEVAVVCMNRACERAAASLGLVDVVRPERPRMGAMVVALVGHLQERIRHVKLGRVDLSLRGALAVVDGEEVWLAERERALLAALARRPGTVVAKDELLRRVWRSDGIDGADGHTVEVAVARLRRRLGPAGAALESVPRRGYRLAAE